MRRKLFLWLAAIFIIGALGMLLIRIYFDYTGGKVSTCFRWCMKLYGDHDDNPITPMINRDKFYECIDSRIIKYGYEK